MPAGTQQTQLCIKIWKISPKEVHSKVQPCNSLCLPNVCSRVTLLRPCHSVSQCACRDKEAIKTVKCFFPFPPTHFSFDGAFLARWAGGSGGSGRRLMERATWTNPVWNQGSQVQPDLWLPTLLFPHRGPSQELLDVLDPVYYLLSPLSTLSLSCPTFPFFFFFFFLKHIFLLSSSISLSGISFALKPPPLLPDILASCSSRQGVYSCLCKAELQFKR